MIADVISDARQRMSKTVDAAREDFGTVSAGRANPALFQKVLVDYYGSPTPLAQLAGLQNPEARVLLVTPYDKSALKDIEKAIVNMPNLSANVGNDGEIVRVTLPELTEDRRKEFVKIVRGKGEDAKVALRNIRRRSKDDLDALKGEVGDDELARAEKELEAITRTHVDAVDDALKRKEAELLEV
ncbi:ribosome recycling factor [Leifsonia sp. 98AMF]|uniref:ribosome recycling factor n=1 Tax=Microbacteriaceae TaxID=85023 RepID=UPI00035C6BC4|nr:MULTISPECIES: ribosome recycling factor [Microbacteriaceae]TDQ03517.1 ribosome recycling factor [Leifsonia sp. 115AMFTsu3.1]SDH29975.1 ribosome recycling factor [Leifsonia sp. 197AMF]SDJ06782.1 ribosome recycling factor [Leifsonia sp. 466MF]SDJ64854.1 ribosome recycling factor [Leifsonia sp. 157MF]SDN27534.1 ribosome recycling factor [Leifsonia sp. 509MF]